MQAATRLLRRYGLNTFPTTESPQEMGNILSISDASSAISLRSTHASVHADGVHDEFGWSAPDSCFLKLLPQPFTRAANSHLRFRRLFRDYHLQAIDRTKYTVVPVDSSTAQAPVETSATQNGVEVGDADMKKPEGAPPSRFIEDEPRWMVWSVYESCD